MHAASLPADSGSSRSEPQPQSLLGREDAQAFAALTCLAKGSQGDEADLPLFPPLNLARVERAVYALVDDHGDGPACNCDLFATSIPPAASARLRSLVTAAVRELEAALNQFGDASDGSGLALSFNGGKDCTVLLHLLAAVWHRRFARPGSRLPSIRTVHVAQTDEFPEEARFVAKCAARCVAQKRAFLQRTSWSHIISSNRYPLDLHTHAGPMRPALTAFHQAHPHIRAVCVGSRSTDPYCGHLTPQHPCDVDQGWPPLMRINPLLSWRHADIWLFLFALGVEYCPLYDLGYTSLGARGATVANPALQLQASGSIATTEEGARPGEQGPAAGAGTHWPAWMLADSTRERDGRSK